MTGHAVELDVSSLAAAVERFSEGVDLMAARPDETIVRDGVIQRFEFTYELAHKMLKRYLEMTAANPDAIDAMTFQDLIRTGFEQGLLLHSWDAWRAYRQSRTHSDASHAYDEEKALRVIESVPAFLEEARHLLAQLRQRTETP